MNIFVVTVTYGNRFDLLKKVIDRALSEGAAKVIVVDNNSMPESRQNLRQYENVLGVSRIKVLYLDDNYGSAGGFKNGLEEAYNDKACEYILALDDDNLLEEGAFDKIGALALYLYNLNNNFMLGFCREKWRGDKRAITEGWVKGYLPNNFNGFNFYNVIKNRLFPEKVYFRPDFYPLQPAQVNAMGGLFFHKSILQNIGYPDDNFYLYADDHDFTFRYTKSGGKLFLCSELKIFDLDFTATSLDGKEIGYFDEEYSEFKMYYGARNHAYISRYFVVNKAFFYMNMLIIFMFYATKIFKTSPALFIRRYKLLLRAVSDGLNGRLGRRF